MPEDQVRGELLDRLQALRVAERDGMRAPHKPLLLLYALARVQAGEPRLVAFAEAEGPLQELLDGFGPPRPTEPRYPFWHLRTDGLWDVPAVEEFDTGPSSRRPGVTALRAAGWGGFVEEFDRALRDDPELVRLAAHAVLDRHFEPSLHDPIASAVGLDLAAAATVAEVRKRKRDRAFRHRVLVAYEHRCAACGWNAYLGSDAFGLEAAHVLWHTHGGPDELDNGLCLCALHHLALDRGALSIDDEYRLLVSQHISGSTGVADGLHALAGRPLGRPQPGNPPIRPDHADWHRAQVFRAPARAA
ncbi:phosphorothioated DNA-binding restriction endonuclease [Paraconexibacter algicola]|uniref:Restriction endonuclease n=1 Tax=Paraconexibacter algicola TaxID=2133960 RepID=A0A2T4UDI4_9ACTN|nr:HNH endonuclease [Paraconexibacter algicola]PTL55564.1 restriction endonuclease [Paraconexibacter algicola]